MWGDTENPGWELFKGKAVTGVSVAQEDDETLQVWSRKEREADEN